MFLRLAPLWWGMGAMWIALDFWLCLQPPSATTGLLPDKVAHFTMYFLLCGWFASLAPRRLLLVFSCMLALGAFIELLQAFTPERVPDWKDMVANASGALLALVIVQQLPVNPFAWFERVAGLRHEA